MPGSHIARDQSRRLPQPSPQSDFQTPQRPQVRPHGPLQDRQDSRVVDPAGLADRASGPVAFGLPQVERDSSGGLDDRVVSDLIGPVIDEVRGHLAGTSRHVASVGLRSASEVVDTTVFVGNKGNWSRPALSNVGGLTDGGYNQHHAPGAGLYGSESTCMPASLPARATLPARITSPAPAFSGSPA